MEYGFPQVMHSSITKHKGGTRQKWIVIGSFVMAPVCVVIGWNVKPRLLGSRDSKEVEWIPFYCKISLLWQASANTCVMTADNGIYAG